MTGINFTNPAYVALVNQTRFPAAQTDPTDDPSLWAWYSSDTGLINNGIKITGTWEDRSGLGHTMTNYPPEPPFYEANGPNGKPAVYHVRNGPISGISSAMFIDVSALSQPYAIFALLKLQTWEAGHFFWDCGVVQGYLAMITSSPRISIYAGANLNNDTLTVDQWCVVTCVYDGANSYLQVDNLAASIGNAGTDKGSTIVFNQYGGGGIVGSYWYLAALTISASNPSANIKTLHKNWLADYGGLTI